MSDDRVLGGGARDEADAGVYALAMLRIAVAPMMLLAPGFRESARVAAWDHARWVTPEGLGWFVAVVPIDTSLVTISQGLAAVAALHALVGLRTRLALAVLAITSFYLYSIAQLTGFVWHDMHLLWMSALLAVSPCDRVLAMDSSLGPPAARRQVLVALWVARVLLATVYFFPGLHKLMTSGFAWATGDNLLNQLYWKWLQYGSPPPLRLDRAPWLLKVGGLFTLSFELLFPALLWRRPTRELAAGLGLLFHIMSAAVLRISFPSLWFCYVVLVEPRRLRLGVSAFRRWLRLPTRPDHQHPVEEVRANAATTRSGCTREGMVPLVIVAAALLAGAITQGARGQMSSYPFACYPTFQWITPNVMPDLAIELVSSRNVKATVVHARDHFGARTQRQWGEIFRLAGATGPIDHARLAAYWATVARSAQPVARLDDVKSIRFYRDDVSVLPEHRGLPPVRHELIWEATAPHRDGKVSR